MLIVELVGLAGAGKTTLSSALRRRHRRMLLGVDIELRKIMHIPIFVRHVFFLLPILLSGCRLTEWFTWDEIKTMVYLKAWPDLLRKQTSDRSAVILLDHGPVFRLATLDAFGSEALKSRDFEDWWNRMLMQWAFTLDMVIWLDAPDSLLMQRINSRGQRHAVKGKPEQDATRFLARYRTSYERILGKLANRGSTKLLRFDTSQTSMDRVVEEVVVACNLSEEEVGTAKMDRDQRVGTE